MTERAAGERTVLPGRSYAWSSQNGLALLAVVAVVGGIAWIVVADARFGLILIAAGLGWFLNRVLAFKREEDAYRVVVDAKGISSTRNGEVVDTVSWKRVTAVEFDSGERSANWGMNGLGVLPHVRCLVGEKVAVSVALPVFGRRGLSEIDETLRAASAAHSVAYRSDL